MYSYLFQPLGVPIFGHPLKRDSSDYLASAAMLNASINNSIQAQENWKARRQASEFFYKNLEEQWKAIKENEWYNSPLNQRQMFEAAGFSPYAMFGSESSINGSVGSSTQPHNTLPQFDNSGFSSAAQILNQSKIADAQSANLAQQTAGLTIDNFSKDAMNQAKISEMLESAGYSASQAFFKNLESLVAQNSIDSLVAANNENVNLIKSQISKNYSDAAYNNSLRIKTSKETAWIDVLNRQNLSLLAAQTATQASIQNMNYEQAKTLVANRLLIEAQKRGQDISNYQAENVADQIIDQETYKSLQESTKLYNLQTYGSSEITSYDTEEHTTPLQQYLGGNKNVSNVPRRLSRDSGRSQNTKDLNKRTKNFR